MKNCLKLILLLIARGVVGCIGVLFPLQKKTILMMAYSGKQYSCNPKAITEYYYTHYKNAVQIVWVFRDKKKYNYLSKYGIKVISFYSLQHLYYKAVAGTCVDNLGSFVWNTRRREQLRINTWHAGGFYKEPQENSDRISRIQDFINGLNDKTTTHFISSNKCFTEYEIGKCHYRFNGTILDIGLPRNDLFWDEKRQFHYREKTRMRYNIDDDIVVLYAPTWRDDGKLIEPDWRMIIESVQKATGKSCKIMYRNHNLNPNALSNNELIDVSSYPDVQELICGSDMLISDYSSIIWDYSFTEKPCFLYAYDLDKYREEVGFEIDIYKWGFPVCRTNAELSDSIARFDRLKYLYEIDMNHKELGSFETGTATKTVVDLINSNMKNDDILELYEV